MSELSVVPVEAPTRPMRYMKYALQALVLLPIVAGFFAYRLWIAPPAAPSEAVLTTVSAQMLEERFGLRVNLIAVTAGGGIIDLRYKVIDKDKAAFLLGDTHTMPSLVVEESGVTLTPPDHTMKHNSKLESGSSYFQFYPNTRNAVQPGNHVAIVIGSIRLEPMVVK